MVGIWHYKKKKASLSSKKIHVGPWGGNGGIEWDDGSFSGVQAITLKYGRCIDSIRIEYDKNGKSFFADKHGGDGGSHSIHGYGTEDGVFCGVFDGHGKNGHTVSRMVRDYLPSLLLSYRNTVPTAADSQRTSDAGDCLKLHMADAICPALSQELWKEWNLACFSGFKAMDSELKLLTNLDCSYSGTTAVAIIKQGKDVIIANLGDSRAVLGTVSEGQLKAVQLTTDLIPSVPQEAERIRRSNGQVFAMEDEPRIQRMWMPNNNSPGLAMARAFGDFQLKNYGLIADPQLTYHRITHDDQFIVLATDGVWDVLSNEQVVMLVSAEEKRSGEAAKVVVEAAGKAWRRKFPSSRVDDCSAVCLFLQDRRRGNGH